MKKRLMTAVLVLAMALSVIAPLTVSAAIELDENGNAYYYDENNVMQTGWVDVTEEYSGRQFRCYADENGVLQTGWLAEGNNQYYLNPGPEDQYHMVSGEPVTIDGKIYFFKSNGALDTTPGWKAFLKGAGGNKWCYVGAAGNCLTGWQKIDGTWYYFYPNGYMVFGGAININGKLYVFENSGALCSSAGWKGFTSQYTSNPVTYWYYTNADGTAVTGWKLSSGRWYFLNPIDGIMIDNTLFYVNSKLYFFEKGGALVSKTGWQSRPSFVRAYKKTLWYYVYSDGTVATGWKKINGTWYFLKDDGEMAASEWYGGYWLNANGSWTYKPIGSWHQNSTGWWFGDTSGWYAKNQEVQINGLFYRFNSAGYWVQ